MLEKTNQWCRINIPAKINRLHRVKEMQSTENINIRTYMLLACKSGNNSKHEYKNMNTTNMVTHKLSDHREWNGIGVSMDARIPTLQTQ